MTNVWGWVLAASLLCGPLGYGQQQIQKEYIYVGSRLIAIEGTGNQMPTSARFTKPANDAASGLITFAGIDPDGAGDIASLRVIVGASRTDPAACDFTWTRIAATQVSLSSGGTITLGQASPLAQNAYCKLSGQGGSSGTGAAAGEQQVQFTLTMLSTGQKNIYIEVKDLAGATAVGGWFEAGSWLVPGGTPTGTMTATFTPPPNTNGFATKGVFSFEVDEPRGVGAIGYLLVIIKRPIDGGMSCFFSIAADTGLMQLRRDPENNPEWGQVEMGSANSASNGRCRIKGEGSSYFNSGLTKLRANVNLEFLDPYRGTHDIHITTLDPQQGNAPPWIPVGTWMVSNVASAPPLPVSLILPGGGNSGTGLADTFTFRLTDPNGWADIGSFAGLVHSEKNGGYGCYFFYSPPPPQVTVPAQPQPSGGIHGAAWSIFTWPAAPAMGSGVHGDEPRCRVDGSQTQSRIISDTTMELQVRFLFGDSMKAVPQKKVYAWLRDKAEQLAPSPIGDDIVGYYSVVQTATTERRQLARLKFDGNLTNSAPGGTAAVLGAGTASYSASPDPAFGQVLQLNGATRVRLTGSVPVAARTYAAWVYWDGQNSGLGLPLVTSGNSGTADFFGLSGLAGGGCATNTPGRLYWDHWGVPCVISAATVPANQWAHVAVTTTGSSVNFYLNGQLTDSFATAQFTSDLSTFDIGGNSVGGTTTRTFFTGKLDDLQVYNYALSAADISNIVNEFRPEGTCQGAMELWPNYVSINPATAGQITVNLPTGCTAAAGYSVSVQLPYEPAPFTAPFTVGVTGTQLTFQLNSEPAEPTWKTYNMRVVLMKGGVEYTYVAPGSGEVRKLEAPGMVRVNPTPQAPEITLTPSTGAGLEQSFQFRRYWERSYSQSTEIQHILIGPGGSPPTSAINQCYFVVLQQNRRVALFNDDATASSMYDVGYGAPSTGTEVAVNSRCKLHQNGSKAWQAWDQGNQYHYLLNKITFDAGFFGGEKGIWALENGDWTAPATSGMKKIGTWTVRPQ